MSTSPPENLVILNLMESYGPILIGSIFSCVVWGISCMQLFLYYLNCGNDHVALKYFVAFVWLVDTANQMLLLASMWPVLILKWGSLAELSVTQPPLVHHGWVAGIVAFCVQMFFLYRIYRFSGNSRVLPALLIPLALWQIIGQIPFDIWIFQDSSLAALSERRMVAFETALRATSAFLDITIAVAMVYLLAKNRRSAFNRSKLMVMRLILITINTGLWTAVVALIDFSLIAAFPSGLYFCAFEFPLSSLYVNTLLANLNARSYLRQADADAPHVYGDESGTSSMALRNMSASRGTATKINPTVAIRVDTANVVDTDYSLDKPQSSSV